VGQFEERGFANARHVGLERERDFLEGPATAAVVHVNSRRAAELGRHKACAAEAETQGHDVAARVGSGDELFGVGARFAIFILETLGRRVGRAAEYARRAVEFARAVCSRAAPRSACCPLEMSHFSD
jgi:hypothetical protein